MSTKYYQCYIFCLRIKTSNWINLTIRQLLALERFFYSFLTLKQ